MRTDYYTGFEGHPSIVIKIEGKIESEHKGRSYRMELWNGYFTSLIELIKPSLDGNWEGLALYYHTDTGWYDEDNWPLDNVKLAMDQLSSIVLNDGTNSLLGQESNLILDEIRTTIVGLLKEALRLKMRVIIHYN